MSANRSRFSAAEKPQGRFEQGAAVQDHGGVAVGAELFCGAADRFGASGEGEGDATERNRVAENMGDAGLAGRKETAFRLGDEENHPVRPVKKRETPGLLAVRLMIAGDEAHARRMNLPD